MTIRFAGSGVAVLFLVLTGCPSTSPDSSSLPRATDVSHAKTAAPNPRPLNETAVTPSLAACPTTAPVDCPDGCCPAGTVCGPFGGCEEIVAQSCGAQTPLACTFGVTLEDASIHGRHALLTAGTLVGGKFLRGLRPTFPGSSEPCAPAAAMAPAAGFPTGAAPSTVEGWFRATVPAASGVAVKLGALFSQGLRRPKDERTLRLSVDAEGWLEASFGGCGPFNIVTGRFESGRWYHVAATYGASTTRLYLDGVIVIGCEGTSTLSTTATRRVGIGGGPPDDPNCVDERFRGDIDSLQVLDYASTAAEIAMRAAGGAPSPDSRTVALWQFDENDLTACCASTETCGTAGSCAAASLGPSVCPPGAPLACAAGFCCPTGSTCGATGCIVPSTGTAPFCPSGYPKDCNDGTCCASYEGVCSNRCCPPTLCTLDVAPANKICASGAATCGGLCCPSGANRCEGNQCVRPGTTPACASGVACGAGCCPPSAACGPGNSCISSQAIRPACPCRAGFVCGRSFGSQVICRYTGTRPPRLGPQGPSCGSGRACEAGSECSLGSCCAKDRSQRCGDNCCLNGSSCTAGGCGCPSGETACGETCCGAGVRCVEGTCESACAAEAFPIDCAEMCCAVGGTCSGGTCQCPAAFSVACGLKCCLSGASCGTDGECTCPTGRAVCGDTCCAKGEACVGGRCGAATSNVDSGTGSCANGLLASTATFGALGSTDGCVKRGNLSTCISRSEYESATGQTLPSACTPDGEGGCITSAGTLVRPCCPGSTCVYRERCGGGTGVGGLCLTL